MWITKTTIFLLSVNCCGNIADIVYSWTDSFA